MGFPGGSVVKVEKAMAPHSSTLAWTIPWVEEPGRLQSMGSLRVGHNWATSLSLFTFMHWRRKWQPTPVFLPGESQGWREPGGLPFLGSQSWTWLKRLSSSSSSSSGKGYVCQVGEADLIPGSGRSPGKEMATHSSNPAWEIPWTEKPSRLWSTGLQRSQTPLSN